MKRLSLLTFCLLSAAILSAQDIALPAPVTTGGMPLMDALTKRQSTRSFSNKPLDMQTLSNLLWAAYGFNRDDKRVVPSAQNRQEIELYVFTKEGAYLYDAKANRLVQRIKGDYRKDTGSQDYIAPAPLNLLMVANIDKASSHDAACHDCGFISQNVYLFCASEGLATVVRGMVPRDKMKNILKLTDTQEVMLAQTVGFAK